MYTHTEAFTHKKMFVTQYKLQKYEIDKKLTNSQTACTVLILSDKELLLNV